MAFLIPRILSRHSEVANQWFFKKNGYYKYGLYHDDLLGGYNNTVRPTIAEAYRRLMIDKPDLHDERCFRGIRAAQLKIQKDILPEDQWVTYEEDMTKGRYLQPYLEQLRREMQEKEAWEIENAS